MIVPPRCMPHLIHYSHYYYYCCFCVSFITTNHPPSHSACFDWLGRFACLSLLHGCCHQCTLPQQGKSGEIFDSRAAQAIGAWAKGRGRAPPPWEEWQLARTWTGHDDGWRPGDKKGRRVEKGEISRVICDRAGFKFVFAQSKSGHAAILLLSLFNNSLLIKISGSVVCVFIYFFAGYWCWHTHTHTHSLSPSISLFQFTTCWNPGFNGFILHLLDPAC